MSDIRAELDKNIPESAVTEREAYKGGPTLSYLTSGYVINRLNQVLGQGNWGYSVSELSKVFEGTIEQRNGKAFTVSYIARVILMTKVNSAYVATNNTSLIPTTETIFEDVGYGDGTDKNNPGKAHELATKEAVTDALKRAAKNLGISMGLGLYFKDGKYVGETTNTDTQVASNSPRASSPNGVNSANNKQPISSNAVSTNKKPIKEAIKAAFKVLEAQKRASAEEFKIKYLSGVGLSKLTEEQATSALVKVKADFPELPL